MHVVARSEDEPAKFAWATKWTLGWLIYNFQALLNPGWHLELLIEMYIFFIQYIST